MDTVRFSKTLASTDESTRRQNPEENTFILTAVKTIDPSPVGIFLVYSFCTEMRSSLALVFHILIPAPRKFQISTLKSDIMTEGFCHWLQYLQANS
jgi:hypothetical protein